MLNPAFNFNLNIPIEENKVISCSLDGKNVSLIGVTLGGKVFIYTP